jgi:hypothetical protein
LKMVMAAQKASSKSDRWYPWGGQRTPKNSRQ